ncbi:MAG: transcriptional repressor [Vallitalea sp.]|nr:transcriptional repressor [Vallitalea sp.]
MFVNSEEFKKILKEKGFKLTTQRRTVLDVLQRNEGKHLTAEEIYEIVKKDCPEIGLATVYRTIQLLHELKLIDKLNLDDGYIRYEIGKFNNDHHHHHHLICERCGNVIEVEDDLMESIEERFQNNYDFQVTDHKVKFYGICRNCKDN